MSINNLAANLGMSPYNLGGRPWQ